MRGRARAFESVRESGGGRQNWAVTWASMGAGGGRCAALALLAPLSGNRTVPKIVFRHVAARAAGRG